MEDLDLPDHYRRKIKQLIYEYNRVFPLPYYFGQFLKGKNEAEIADIGSGPVCTLGTLWGDVKVNIYASDVRAPVYKELVKKENCNLLTPVEFEDMENLTYPDNFFDVVHCVNALDHTQNARKAIEEMKRVCKKDGFIYLRHAHNQLNANGGRGHYWNASESGFSNGETLITLDGFRTVNESDYLVSIWRK